MTTNKLTHSEQHYYDGERADWVCPVCNTLTDYCVELTGEDTVDPDALLRPLDS